MSEAFIKYAYVVALAVAAVFLQYLFKPLFDPLRSIPGPFLTRYTRLWQLRMFNRGDIHRSTIDLHRRHGSVVRIGPNQYSFVDPEAAKAIYAISTNFKKSTFYFPWGDPTAEQQNIFQVQDVKKHQEDRRKMAPMFSLTSLLSYEPYVDSSNEVLCRRLRGFAERDQTFDLVRWMQYYAFDVIGEITFSRTFGMMNRGADVAGILETIHMAAVIPAHLGIIPELTGAFHYITALLTKEHPFTSLNRYCEGATEARKAGKAPSDREDFLAKALKLVDAGKMDERLAHVTLLGNILAGSDTTGVTLSAILYYLIRNPHSMRKLQQELDEAAQSGKLSQPGTFSEASKLPYLQAVIKEGLRIHPAVGMQMPRVIPAGGKELAGHFFAANTIVGVNAWALHRNADIFGSDVDEFRPERWLGLREDVARMEQFLYSFGSGSRSCLGKHVSLLEINKIIPRLLREFQFAGRGDSVWTTHNHWFVKPSYQCRVSVRNLSESRAT